MHQASLTFDTAVMRTDEIILFVKAAVEAGTDLETAYEDMKMIDAMLNMRRLHFATLNHNRYTRSGNLKKRNMLTDVYDDMINSRVNR